MDKDYTKHELSVIESDQSLKLDWDLGFLIGFWDFNQLSSQFD